MTKRELMIKAHKMAKEIKAEYPAIDYKFQLGLCLSYLYENEGENEMVELKGSEKQVAWAKEIREIVVEASRRNLECKQKFHDEKPGKKMRVRLLEDAKELNEKIENEESAKFFIENFAFLQKEKRSLEEIAKEVEISVIDEITTKFLDTMNRL